MNRTHVSNRGSILLPTLVLLVLLGGLSTALYSTVSHEAQMSKLNAVERTRFSHLAEGIAEELKEDLLNAIVNRRPGFYAGFQPDYFNDSWQVLFVPEFFDPSSGLREQFDSEFRSNPDEYDSSADRDWSLPGPPLYVRKEERFYQDGEVRADIALIELKQLPMGSSSTYYRTFAPREKVDADGVTTIYQPAAIQVIVELRRELPSSGGERRWSVITRESFFQIVEIANIDIFQFAIFYEPDLEILPGPNMTLSGRIHSNHDIYIGSGDSLRLRTDYVRCAGSIHRERKDAEEHTAGNVYIKKRDGNLDWGDDEFVLMESEDQLDSLGIDSDSGFDSAFEGFDRNGDGDYQDFGEMDPFFTEAFDKWDGTLQTGEHGVTKIQAPNIGSIKRFEEMPGGTGGDWNWNDGLGDYVPAPPGAGTHQKGFYHRRADLVVRGSEVYYQGVPINVPNLIRERTMYDGRENKEVTVTDIDMDVLNDSGYFPANGLIYASRSASANDPNGIRLVNGSELANKLTVVSENPVYVQGDYNTENKKGAAVITDSINLLSNAWDDSKEAGELPSASQTTFNMAIITGNDESSRGNYNGGFENLPRFHESWSGVECRIRGSFVNIYESEIGTGPWSYGGDNYTAPVRNWDFDQDFMDRNNLPPFTPTISTIERSLWMRQ
ncbi:MAG: hypothetical protein RL885_13685 [Planctomycetota bacterium]